MPLATSSDSYSCSNPCNLLLLMEYLDTIALDSQPDQDFDQQRYSAGSSAKICAPWVCRMFVYSGVQEWLFNHQEESE